MSETQDKQTQQPAPAQQVQATNQVAQQINPTPQKPQVQPVQEPPKEEKRVAVSTNEIAKLKKELFLDVSKNIYYGNFKNYRIDENIQQNCKKVIESYYFMQGSLGACLAYFGGRLLFSRKQRYTKSNLDMAAILLLTLTAGVSGFIYDKRIHNVSQYFMWENGKFKNINIVEYKKDRESYVKYLLEE